MVRSLKGRVLVTALAALACALPASADAAADATISGHVTLPSGDPADAACVTAIYTDGSSRLSKATVNGSGDYTITGLPAGTYKVRFWGCQYRNGGQYLDQYFDGKSTGGAGAPVTLAGGEARTGVDAVMQTGRRFRPRRGR